MRVFVRFVSIAIMALLILPAWAEDGPRRIETTADSDYFGFDLRTVQNIALEDCKAICLGDRQCKAFTYNVKAQWCFLKSDYRQINSFAGAIAGRVVSGSDQPEIGAAPPLDFVPATSLDEARAYRERLMTRATDTSPAARIALIRQGDAAALSGDQATALRNFAAAIPADPEASQTWLALARAALAYAPTDEPTARGIRSVAVSAAINAYQTSRTTPLRADALAALGSAYERIETWRPALDSWRASLALREAPGLRSAYADLRARQGFRVVDTTVDADAGTPRACIQFSEALRADLDYASFVSVADAPSSSIEVDGQQICVDGLSHGSRYMVTLRQGLPAGIDEALEAPVELTVYVRDRTPAARFTGNNFVLPSKSRRGIPLVTINAPLAHLELYRVGERGLTSIMTGSQFLSQLDGYSAERMSSEIGEPVFKGTIEIAPELNREVTTSISVDEILPERKPGVYVLTAKPEGDKSESWTAQATQWFVVSDIGMSTFAGTDGLSVFIRSLDSAQPLAGVELTLLARNNELLGSATTDAQGRAVFTPGLVRGVAGLAPAALLARHGTDDFAFLDMTRGGFDLSDRGVAGRPAPGGIDVLAWTERGIYRAGETVHLSALVRDQEVRALDGIPLTVILQRPDGVEDRRVISDGQALGGHAVAMALPGNAMQGAWQARLFTDPDQPALAEQTFLVEDFQPDRIEFDLSSASPALSLETPALLEIKGRYLYGAPASGLTGEGDVVLRRVRSRDAYPGYEFGLADEELEDLRITLEGIGPLDEAGRGEVEVALTELPATSQFVTADVTIRLAEGGGRAVERKLSLDVALDGPRIGIDPAYEDGQVPENSQVAFNVIAINAGGGRISMDGARWSLIRIERTYQWYRTGESWNYEAADFTTEVADGEIDLSAADPVAIKAMVGWGRYRLDVTGTDGAESSVVFDAGYHVETTSTETPDGLEMALDKESYLVGETAKLRLSPRFAGEVLITAGAERLLTVTTVSTGEEGVTIDLPVTADWGAGAYVMATLFRPADDSQSRMPMRAIGVKWLSVAPGARKLDVAFDLPGQTLPRAPLTIPIKLAGLAAGTEAYVSVAAVDVGILNLTRHLAADPEAWYFGQRALGLEIRDIYGRLIDGSAGTVGRIRTGGDGPQMRSEGSPPKERLVAFFEGPVTLDAEGRAEVIFDIPQFNGTVRVSAVAWTAEAVGHAEQDVIIRDPVVITTSLPQFLAPGDGSEMLVEFANTDAPAGSYAVAISALNGRVEIGGATSTDIALVSGGKVALRLPLTGLASGSETLTIALTGPDGQEFTREDYLDVRPSAMPVTTRRVVTLAAGGGSIRIDRELLAGSLLEGASVSVGVTRNAAFDIAALLMALDRYPYGCAEQTTSRALPLLYLSELQASDPFDDQAAVRVRIDEAIARLVSYQAASGSFGLWEPGSGDLWLDAYVTDFLTRAGEKGFAVPQEARRLALDNLANTLAYTTDVSADGSGIAYGLYVLARNRKASASDLRYYSDTRIQSFREPLARAQIGAALSLYGDATRAAESFRSAVVQAKATAGLLSARTDYGSALRDGAGILALAAESTPAPGVIPEMIGFVSEQFGDRKTTSTQEQAWMVLASRALSEANRAISVDVNGRAFSGAWSTSLSGDEVIADPMTVINRGSEAIEAVITTLAAPSQPLSAGGTGFTIDRSYFTLEGEPVSISSVRQNDRFVVVLQMSEANAWPSRVIVTDLLPAGFAIDNPRLVGSAEVSQMAWLGTSEAVHAEFRTDRFVAAFDRSSGSNRSFLAAYVVRAVSPGTYIHPAAVVENMYRPELAARTATGILEITGAGAP